MPGGATFRMASGVWAGALFALVLSACGENPQMAAQKRFFEICQTSVKAQYPDTPGEIGVDAKHIEDVGNGIETCMVGSGYAYDEAKPGCQLPPPYDARFYWQKSKVECYAPHSAS